MGLGFLASQLRRPFAFFFSPVYLYTPGGLVSKIGVRFGCGYLFLEGLMPMAACPRPFFGAPDIHLSLFPRVKNPFLPHSDYSSWGPRFVSGGLRVSLSFTESFVAV